MDFKKILILAILLAVVFLAAGAVSAGLFDSGDDSFTLSGKMTKGSIDFELTNDEPLEESFYMYDQILSCDIDLSSATDDEINKIKEHLDSEDNTCNITDGDSWDVYGNESNLELTLSGKTLHISADTLAISYGEANSLHSDVTGGKLVLPTDGGNITIDF